MKILAYNQNGKVALIVPAPGVAIADLHQLVPAGVEAIEMDQADIPQDRQWRDAWELQGGQMKVSLAKAKEIKLGRLAAAKTGLPANAADRIDAAKNLSELEGIK